MAISFQKKISILTGAGVLALAGGLACFRHTQAAVLETLAQGMEQEFDEKVRLGSASLATMVNDYSYWDDMVAFLAGNGRGWAAANIDPCIPTAGADAVWIRRADFSPAYTVTDARAAELKTIPVPPEAGRKLFADSRVRHFFARCPAGLVEVYGATIHPSSDSERRTEPKGALLAGRLWTREYVGKIAALTGGSIELFQPGGIVARGRSDYLRGTVVFSKTLADCGGKPLLCARVSMASPLVARIAQAQRRQLYLAAVLGAGGLILLYGILMLWVSRPLRRLTGDMMHEDTAGLPAEAGEFGIIGRRLDEMLDRTARLEQELAERRHTQEALDTENGKLARQVTELTARLAAGDGEALTAALLQENAGLKSAYAELEQNFKKRTAELHAANDLLQCEMTHGDRQYKAELVKAIYERKQAEAALQQHREMIDELKGELARSRQLLRERDGAPDLVQELTGARFGGTD
jgi:hypothetical protein